MSDRPPPAKGPVQGLPSDSHPGEGVVQVNDAHVEDPKADEEPVLEEQHPTGG